MRKSQATSMPEKSRSRARGVDRAFHILNYLQEQNRPMRANEIAEGIGAPKSTVYDLIGLLLEHQVLEYFDPEGRLFLGRKLYFFSLSYLRNFDLAREAGDYLAHMTRATRETAQLCMLDGHQYTVVMMKEGERPFRISANIGEPVPLPWTASGRLLVSHLSDAEVLDFIPANDFILPNGRKLAPATFLAQVQQARDEDFFSIDSVVDTFTHCLAAPVYNNERACIATLCLVAPRDDAASHHRHYRKVLTESAAQLSQKLAGDAADTEEARVTA